MSKFEVLKLQQTDVHFEEAAHETVWLLLTGALEVRVGKQSTRLERRALFEEPAAMAHVSAGAEVELLPAEACELLVFRVPNPVVGLHRLAVSESVVAAGAWSSALVVDQPSLLHFRFATPEGFGHVELEERVVKVRSGATLEAPAGVPVLCCASPAAAMYIARSSLSPAGERAGVRE